MLRDKYGTDDCELGLGESLGMQSPIKKAATDFVTSVTAFFGNPNSSTESQSRDTI
ncbi:MAG: hypothetical protein ACOYEQ_02390 [Bacillota bacterium]